MRQLFPTATAVKLLLTTAALAAIAPASAAADSTRMIVAFKPGKMAGAMMALQSVRGAVVHQIAGMEAVAVALSPQELSALRHDPNVEYIEPDRIRRAFSLTSPSTGTPYAMGQLVPYGIKLVQADRLSDVNAGNRKLCIIDSGYNHGHEDLGTTGVTGEYDAGTGNWYTDENHHGTHVAGTVAAINNSGTGVVGVNANRRLKLHIVKVFGADDWTYSSTLASAAYQCGAAGANVISMSLGGSLPTTTEQRAFDELAAKGVLSIAAAGNDGSTALTYPAAYSSVMMVGALNEYKAWASFSQYNSKVELAAPGVGVLSTVPMNSGVAPALKVGSRGYAPGIMEGSPFKTASAPLADFGLGDRTSSAVSGKVCLIARGAIEFSVKVGNCRSSGGVGAVVYNNVAGSYTGTLGAATTIPSVTASDWEGTALRSQLGQIATVAVKPINYAYFNGTSMATPHVAAVAALVWSYFPTCSGTQIRNSLGKSALDLGAPGRDPKYGFGLVQAKAAYDRIRLVGCGN